MTAYKQVDHNLPYWPPEFKFLWPAMDESLHGDIQTLLDVDEHVMPLLTSDRRRTVIQAGGAVGMWAKRFAQLFNTVYTFEPTPESYSCLIRNCEGAPNIRAYHMALGDSDNRFVRMGFPEHAARSVAGKENIGGYRVLDDNGHVPMTTIDAFDLTDLDLIFLDVEGYEKFALEGAVETIKRERPLIVLEDKPGCCIQFGYKVGDIEKWLAKDFGYRAVKRFHGGRNVIIAPS